MSEIRFIPLFSGSSGNSSYIGSGDTRLLVDAGVSGSRVIKELLKAGVDAASLSGILITHDHSDHIAGAGVISRKYDIPIYATEGTWRVMEQKIGAVPLKNVRIISAGEDFYIGGVNVTPFSIPHDAAEPVGFRISDGRASVSVATDMGHMTKEVLSVINGSDTVLIESNYDKDMLRAGPYPYELKKRISSRKGHLSNDDCAESCFKLLESGVKNIILGHLSKENNIPELAYQTTAQYLRQNGVDVKRDVMLSVANRDGMTDIYEIKSWFADGGIL